MPKQCQNCGSLWGDDSRFCGDCGTPLRSAAPRREVAGAGVPAPLLWLMDLCPGAFKPLVLIASLAAIAFALMALWLAVFILQMGAMISAFAIGGAGVMVYWTALGWLLYGYICVPVEAMCEFQSKHWMALVMASVVPAALFLMLMKAAAGR